MDFRTIATMLTDTGGEAVAFQAARSLAQRLNAHLETHCIGVDPTRYEAMPAGAAVVLEDGRAEALSQADALSDWVRAQTGTDLGLSVEDAVVSQLALDRHVAHKARYSDLVVSARPYGDHALPITALTFEAALFGAHVPVLVVPSELTSMSRVMVAWNGTDESMAAVRGALPLLKAAEHVDLVMVDPPSRSPERSDPGGALAVMLGRHGVKAEVSILSKTLARVADTLLDFASNHRSDLIVMGGYGHSRFREALIGGATRDILEESQIPVLMAH